MRPAPGETLLVRLPNPLGDAVAATALLRVLRDGLPGVRLAAAGPAPLAELLAGHPCLDLFLPLPPPARRGMAAPVREARVLRRAGAGTVLLLPNSWSSVLAARLAGIPRRVGRAMRGRGGLLTRRLPPIHSPRPMDGLYLEFAGALGLAADEPAGPVLGVTEEEETRADRRLEAARVTGARPPWLAVAPGAAFGPSKVYPPHLLAEVLVLLRQRADLVPILLGSPAEVPLMEDLARRVGPPLVATHGDPAGLGEMKALLRRARLLLTMDTGARPMAAALEVPQVVLYGPTDPRWSAFAREACRPLGPAPVADCAPCHLARCPTDQRCLAAIPPEVVVAACLELLATGDPGRKETRSPPAGTPG